MRSLESAGIGWRPPFVRSEVIGDRPFEIVHAYVNPNGYDGKPEIVAHLRFLGRDTGGDPIYDQEGHELWECSWSAALTPSREQIARAFVDTTESLGPCQFEFIPGTRPGMSPFANVVTCVDLSLVAVDLDEGRPAQTPTSAPARAGSAPDQRARFPRPSSVPTQGAFRGTSTAQNGQNVQKATRSAVAYPQRVQNAARVMGAPPPDDFDFGEPPVRPDDDTPPYPN